MPEGEGDDEAPLGLGAVWPGEPDGLALGLDEGLCVTPPCCVGVGVAAPCCVTAGVADGAPELAPVLGETVGVGSAAKPCGWVAGAAAVALPVGVGVPPASRRSSQQVELKRLCVGRARVLITNLAGKA